MPPSWHAAVEGRVRATRSPVCVGRAGRVHFDLEVPDGDPNCTDIGGLNCAFCEQESVTAEPVEYAIEVSLYLSGSSSCISL